VLLRWRLTGREELVYNGTSLHLVSPPLAEGPVWAGGAFCISIDIPPIIGYTVHMESSLVLELPEVDDWREFLIERGFIFRENRGYRMMNESLFLFCDGKYTARITYVWDREPGFHIFWNDPDLGESGWSYVSKPIIDGYQLKISGTRALTFKEKMVFLGEEIWKGRF
jgi:hypothetical protein